MAMCRLIGHWTWAMMVCRPALSILSACYAFYETQGDEEVRALWPGVVRELEALVGLFIFFEARLELGWSEWCFATDASEEGFGVVQRRIPIDTARRFSLLCQRRGWLVAVEDTFARLEDF